MVKKKEHRRAIYVYAHWEDIKQPCLMGVLYAEIVRGKEVFSFEYNNEWINSSLAQSMDPNLQLYSGIQYLPDDKINFGVFLDSSPDRWGRLLMKRREAAYARLENRPERNLFETDFLLGVYDKQRIGALRFKEDANGAFLNDDTTLSTPPWTFLSELERISLSLENDDIVNNPQYLKWLNMLIHPGSSLGGARPKASVVDEKSNLWIAKFPSKIDIVNTGGWEMLVNELAKRAGIDVPICQVKKFKWPHHTFLSKRFDRTASGKRIHFASAMTLLGYNDGDDFKVGASYLDLVEFIIKYGANPGKDLKELWLRIVFSIAISNTDDHLRNHGFLLTPKGWILSPAFDINPNPDGAGLTLNISESDNGLDINLAMDVKKYFRIEDSYAKATVKKVKATVQKWQSIAKKYKLPGNEQEIISPAFSRINEF